MVLIVLESVGSVILDKFVMLLLGNVVGDVRLVIVGFGVIKVGGDLGYRGMFWYMNIMLLNIF